MFLKRSKKLNQPDESENNYTNSSGIREDKKKNIVYLNKKKSDIICEGLLKTKYDDTLYALLYNDILILSKKLDNNNFEILNYIKFDKETIARKSKTYKNAMRISSNAGGVKSKGIMIL